MCKMFFFKREEGIKMCIAEWESPTSLLFNEKFFYFYWFFNKNTSAIILGPKVFHSFELCFGSNFCTTHCHLIPKQAAFEPGATWAQLLVLQSPFCPWSLLDLTLCNDEYEVSKKYEFILSEEISNWMNWMLSVSFHLLWMDFLNEICTKETSLNQEQFRTVKWINYPWKWKQNELGWEGFWLLVASSTYTTQNYIEKFLTWNYFSLGSSGGLQA
jgi:hypothetical protein